MFVTGGSGFLGQHLVRDAAASGWQIIAPTSRSMDITDRSGTVETITPRDPMSSSTSHTAKVITK